ncbi:MAG TPA: methyltransferase domain-containing protein [Burkholderiaceae bacterium]|jgi:arsenite methyltransferase|nr:methyltransferase domain-containing protein [Burkholderiaceae bacterium]
MAIQTSNTSVLDTVALEQKVKSMYRDVALQPDGEFHFEMGRALAERLGYDRTALDGVPADAIRSFAGVGHYFDLARIRSGETVVDLGSGSGMDSFLAARAVGPDGKVIGIDMTDEQLAKAERLRAQFGFDNMTFRNAYIDQTGLSAGSCDVVISNGVINLAPDKAAVFREAARLLRTGGRLALADIVTEKPLPEGISCDATLWAACIGGAMQVDAYVAAIEAAGLRVSELRDNPQYQFISSNATNASSKFGVKSISLLATRT